MATGQLVSEATPVARLISDLRQLPLPETHDEPLARPGGAGNVADADDVRRGVGYAVGYKNIAYAEGFDDYSTARVRLERRGDGVAAFVKTAGVEVGQGLVTICQQIVRTELGVDDVVFEAADTLIGNAGSSSASRQTWMTGGAVREAAKQVAAELLRRAGPPGHDLAGGYVVDVEGMPLAPISAVLLEPVEREFEHHHRTTLPLDKNGQGEAHVGLMFVAQRAVVDVDADAGLARVVEVATVQDVGYAINPLQVHGQVEGGVAQGVGLATMEEIQTRDGLIRNASFTDYLLPTALDMPAIQTVLVEEPEPDAPYGVKGVGEPPLIASPAAVCAAIRAATGRRLARIPVTPEQMAGLVETAPAYNVVPGEAP
jgi:CO/xanthine dehydrogenase Mo-binding subunit